MYHKGRAKRELKYSQKYHISLIFVYVGITGLLYSLYSKIML